MLKLKFYVKGNASQMEQRFFSSVSSDRKNQYSCHVLILFGKLPSSCFSSSSLFKVMPFVLFFLISCLMCSIMAHFRRTNQKLFTCSVCIIKVDLYLHVIYDVKTIRRRVKGTLKAFEDFENRQKKCIKLCFLICNNMYILKVYSIHKHKC